MSYNQIAGQNLDRIAALSDGVFAIAMTLLVLDLRVPVSQAIRSEHDLWRALVALAPQFVAYLMTFLTLGILWVGQQTQLNFFARSDRNLAWIQITFLLAVSVTPFSTALLAAFITYRLALVVYWFNVFALGATLYWSWRYALQTGLVRDDTPRQARQAVERRIIIAQSLYAFGALLSVISTYVSIAFIVAVQLNYAVAPRIPMFSRPTAHGGATGR